MMPKKRSAEVNPVASALVKKAPNRQSSKGQKFEKSEPDDRSPEGYSIGYKKPPKESRFLPGKSGNPKGRPKGSLNLKTIYRRVATRQVPVTIDGKQKEVSYLEAAMMSNAQQALRGNAKAYFLFKSDSHLLEDEEISTSTNQERDKATMNSVFERLMRQAKEKQLKPSPRSGKKGVKNVARKS